MRSLLYILIGIFFGIVMYKSEAASWFRIYEMFHFQSFHMYGVIGSALFVGIIGVQLIKHKRLKDKDGQAITFEDKERSLWRYILGGLIFGLGWGLAGACPGPMFVLLGAGVLPIIVVIIGAMAGTWLYGLLRDKLPH